MLARRPVPLQRQLFQHVVCLLHALLDQQKLVFVSLASAAVSLQFLRSTELACSLVQRVYLRRRART